MNLPDDDKNFKEVNTRVAADACYELAKQMAIEFAKWVNCSIYEWDGDSKMWIDVSSTVGDKTHDELFTEWQNSKQ